MSVFFCGVFFLIGAARVLEVEERLRVMSANTTGIKFCGFDRQGQRESEAVIQFHCENVSAVCQRC